MMDLWSRFSQLHTPSSIVFSLSPQRAFSIQNDLHTNALPRPSPLLSARCPGLLHPAAGEVHPEAAAEGRGGGRGGQRAVRWRAQPRGPQGAEESACPRRVGQPFPLHRRERVST